MDGVNKKVLPLPSTTLSPEEENNDARIAKETKLPKKKIGKNFLGLDHNYKWLEIKGQLQLLKMNPIIKTDIRHQEILKGFSI